MSHYNAPLEESRVIKPRNVTTANKNNSSENQESLDDDESNEGVAESVQGPTSLEDGYYGSGFDRISINGS